MIVTAIREKIKEKKPEVEKKAKDQIKKGEKEAQSAGEKEATDIIDPEGEAAQQEKETAEAFADTIDGMLDFNV